MRIEELYPTISIKELKGEVRHIAQKLMHQWENLKMIDTINGNDIHQEEIEKIQLAFDKLFEVTFILKDLTNKDI